MKNIKAEGGEQKQEGSCRRIDDGIGDVVDLCNSEDEDEEASSDDSSDDEN